MDGEVAASGPPANTFSLSPGQERLWFIEQLSPGNSAYNLPEAWRLIGALNVQALEECLTAMVERHESLRTRFIEHKGIPMQKVCAPARFELKPVDDAASEQTVLQMVAAEARKPFDVLGGAPLFRSLLYRLAQDDHVLLVNMHHIISDEWSMGIFFRELAELYRRATGNDGGSLPKLSIQYADFAVWAREQVALGRFEEDLKFWRSHLVGSVPRIDLPVKVKECKATEAQSGDKLSPPRENGVTIFRLVSRGNTAGLKAMATRNRTTLFVVLLTVWKAVLSRFTRQEDIVVGTLESGRHVPETEGVIGFFVNTLPVRSVVSGSTPFEGQIRKVHQAVLDVMSHNRLPLDGILRGVQAQRSTGKHPLFNVLFGLQPGATETWEMPGLRTSRIELDNGGAKFELSLLTTETHEGLRLRCEFDVNSIALATINSLLSSYCMALDQIGRDPAVTISELDLCGAEEQGLLLEKLNDTSVPWPKDKLLHQLFEERAAERPDGVAVIWGAERVTYDALNKAATELAARLSRAGVEVEQPVGICMRRSPRMIVAMLAALKAGAAYVPLDPAYPRERLAFMVRDSGARLVLTEREFRGLCGEGVIELEAEDWNGPAAGPPFIAPQAASDNLAYIIYTSGSTGVPKGVALEHRNAVAFVSWARSWFQASELDGVLAATSICFDLSIFEIFVPLACGGKVVLADNALALSGLPNTSDLTLINTVPSAMREIVRGGFVPASVRVVNLAGEPLDPRLVDEIYASTRVEKVYDLYGPTETTTYSTGTLRFPGCPATIGRPLANERVYLLDEGRRMVPPGAIGEIYIGGAGVGRGYLNRPQLTAERFLPDPFHAGGRMYRTGDLGRWREDGNLEYLGRSDNQVKVRGYRIELGEIEAALRRLPGVKDAVVVVREDHSGDKKTVAYIVCDQEQLSADQMRSALSATLPMYMIPGAFVALSSVPLTPNGKVDRRALPAPEPAAFAVTATYKAPSNPVEQNLVDIWQDLLGRNSFGVTDDFFQLGGHSLLAMQLVSRICSVFHIHLPLKAIFEAPTVAGLSTMVMQMQQDAGGESMIPRNLKASEAADVLARLDSLTDSEVEEILRSTQLENLQP